MSRTSFSQRVNAPRERVYRAILDPVAVAQWQVPDGMTSVVHEFDAREGGPFRISLSYAGAPGVGKTSAHTDTFQGRFEQLVENELIRQSVEFETNDPAMQGKSTILYLLSEVDGATEIAAVHDHVPPGVAPEDNLTGWQMSLGKLAKLVEGQ